MNIFLILGTHFLRRSHFFVKCHWLSSVNQQAEMHCAADQTTEWGHFHNSVISLRAVVLPQHLDYKTLDQRGAKRRDSGTLTCQMAVPLPLLSCRRAATGGSLEAGTYAIQHAWSAVQLVALKHPSEAKHREWRDISPEPSPPHCVPACSSSYSCNFPDLPSQFEYRARRKRDFPAISVQERTGTHSRLGARFP